jgi:Ca2+-binding RTX toxin-like protein
MKAGWSDMFFLKLFSPASSLLSKIFGPISLGRDTDRGNSKRDDDRRDHKDRDDGRKGRDDDRKDRKDRDEDRKDRDDDRKDRKDRDDDRKDRDDERKDHKDRDGCAACTDEGLTYDAIVAGTNIVAGCGDDTFTIGDLVGDATIKGGAGNDVLNINLLNPNFYEIVFKPGSTTDGKVVFFGSDGMPQGTLNFKGIEQIVENARFDGIVQGTSGGDLIDLNFRDRFSLDQVDNNDAINTNILGTNQDTIFAGDGDDTVYGLEGADVVRGQEGNDLIFGGNGNDTLYGSEGSDTIEGNDGDDRIFGDEGNDFIFGNLGADRIFGGTGDDTIVGGDGNDVLYGDTTTRFDGALGADTFVFDTDDGNDEVWDFVAGTDVVQLEGYVAGVNDPTFSYANGNTFMTYGATMVTFRFVTVDSDILLL